MVKFHFIGVPINQSVSKENFIWLDDYTYQWTDDDLYKYFNLSDDEIRIIESEIK